MIEITNKPSAQSCNACTAMNAVCEIILISLPHQSLGFRPLGFRLCEDCRDKLKTALNADLFPISIEQEDL